MPGPKRERKNRRHRHRSPESKAARDARAAQFRRTLTIAASVLVFGSVAAGVLMGVPRLQARLAARELTSPAKIVFHWPGAGRPGDATWLPPGARDELMAVAHMQLDQHPDPFSPTALQLIGQSAAASGWFDRVTSVSRASDGAIHVVGDWRIPVGVIRRDGADYPVARAGEVLPLRFDRGTSRFTAIVGAHLNPASRDGQIPPGSIWPGSDVQAGLELLALISSRPWQHQVAAIDVSAYLSSRQLTLITTRGGRVIWGGGPSDSIPGQVSTQAKLMRIDGLYQQHRLIDAGHRAVWVSGPVTTVDNTASADAS